MAIDTLQAESAATNPHNTDRSAFDAMLAAFSVANTELDRATGETEIDDAADKRHDCMIAMIATPAPDVAGVITKLRAIDPTGSFVEGADWHATIIADLKRLA